MNEEGEQRLTQLYSGFLIECDLQDRSRYYARKATAHDKEAENALERANGLPHGAEQARRLRMVAETERQAAHAFSRFAELWEQACEAAFTDADRELIASIDADSLPDPETLYCARFEEQRWDT